MEPYDLGEFDVLDERIFPVSHIYDPVQGKDVRIEDFHFPDNFFATNQFDCDFDVLDERIFPVSHIYDPVQGKDVRIEDFHIPDDFFATNQFDCENVSANEANIIVLEQPRKQPRVQPRKQPRVQPRKQPRVQEPLLYEVEQPRVQEPLVYEVEQPRVQVPIQNTDFRRYAHRYCFTYTNICMET